MRRRRRADDRGAVLILFGLLLGFLVVLVAFAVDLGQARASKREDSAAADLAALDAGYFLSGRGVTPAVSQPQRACAAAVQAVMRNVDGFPTLGPATITTQCASLAATAALCRAAIDLGNPPAEAPFDAGAFRLVVRYPIPADELDTSGFDGIGVNDGTGTAATCERMRVTLTKRDKTQFARIAGVDEIETEVSAVVRATLDSKSDKPPAFLVLERTDCGALGNSVGGAGNLGIIVETNGSDPGVVHSDSDATTNCSGTTSSAYAVYGSPLSSGSPSIVVEPSPAVPPDIPQMPGIIQTRATNGKGGATFPGGLSVAPTNAGILSRAVVDSRYNPASSPTITNLHSQASTAVRATGVPAGYTPMGCADLVPLATRVYVDCPTFDQTRVFVGVTHVVFANNVNLKTSNVLTFPNATDVTVRGSLSIPSGKMLLPSVQRFYVGGGVSLSNNSGLAVNSTTEASCAGRQPPATWTNTSTMVVFGGNPALDSAGDIAFCQTFVYLAGPKTLTAYSAQQVTTGGTCTVDLPCPKTSGNAATGAHYNITGGTVLWSAPNQFTTAKPPTQGIEDLAYWAEGSGTAEIKSGSNVVLSGVVFAPNATLEVRSPATGSPRDSQFVTRKLFLFQGTLRMKPEKANSISVPVAGTYGLIR